MKKRASINEENELLAGFNPNAPLVTDDIALDYLAELLVEIYLDEKQRESSNSQLHTTEGSHLLPGINKTSS